MALLARWLTLFSLIAPAAVAAAQPAASDGPSLDSARFRLPWRPIGPYRGGRAVAVAGVSTQPLVYYAGFAGGGVWKTQNAGARWRNISDCCFRMGSVGAIAVAESDPNVIYVGMGEHAVRAQSSSWGDGVYKSTDAGQTWQHLGLDDTRQISRVIVHPRDPDIVFVAAQGTRWAPSADRGIYRTVDGGRTWKLILHPSDSSGASELTMDPTNPQVLYAAFWHGQRVPWQIRSGGTTGGIWKTTDGGETWTKLGGGLPTMLGKVGVTISPANPNRVYAAIESGEGGLWRSDDAGATWRVLSGDRRLRGRAWYFMKVAADPRNADVVYVLNYSILKSVDGGRTFTVLPATHGDNHQLWINPLDPRYMINANDGGASITTDGGLTWSTQNNQPTAQIYHVNLDAQFPYWVYGAQQDATTIAIPSATLAWGIGPEHWFPTAGQEMGHIAFDPNDVRYVYGSGLAGSIQELDRVSGTRRNIMAWPVLGLGEPSDELKYRFNWSAPVATSPHDRRVLYHAANVLFRSTDRGNTWTEISPDLTRNDRSTQGFGGTPFTSESGGGEVYGTISALVESPHAAGTIWVGTDDGLVQLTRNGGRTWDNVTPRGLPAGQVNAIEVSPHDPETAYIAFYRVKLNDNGPYIYRTTDAGRTWTKIVDGLPVSEAVRVVREGARSGLLFAGTETGVWVSFDAGAQWQRMLPALPRVPVTDLMIERRTGDLVASTEGRAFWIVSGLHLLEQGLDTTTTARLFRPAEVYRRIYGQGEYAGPDAESRGRNPLPGAVIHFYLGARDTSGVTLDILDSEGRVLRSFSSASRRGPGVESARARLGLNNVVWDLRSEDVYRIPGPYFFNAMTGYRVAPGEYTVRLIVADETFTQPLRVLPDPRLDVSPDDLVRQQQMAARLHGLANDIFRSVRELRELGAQIDRVAHEARDLPRADRILAAAKRLRTRIDSLEPRFVQAQTTNNMDILHFRGGLIDQVLFLRNVVDGADAAPSLARQLRHAELVATWERLNAQAREIFERDVASLNALLTPTPIALIPQRRSPP